MKNNIKRKNQFFFISTSIFFLSSLNDPTEAGKYEFTTDIYNQDSVLQKIHKSMEAGRSFSEEEIDGIMEAELRFRKHQQIKNNYISSIQKKLEFLESKFSIALGEENKRNLIERVGGIFDTVPAVGVSLASNPAGVLIKAGLQMGAQLISYGARAALTSSDIDAHTQPSSIASEVHKLELEAIDLREGLTTEPAGSLSSLEKAYVGKKRKMTDTVLQRQIEEDFLSARQNIQFGMSAAEFIENALRLPSDHKRIDELPESIEDRFNNDPFFSSYDPETREKLKNILLETAQDSRVHDDSEVSLRRIYCFHGIASSGKTSAARKLPEFFGLPYVEKSISESKDLGEVNLEGSRAPFNVNVGWLIRPFLEFSKKEKRSYKNPFLIINDSDNILSPNNATAKAFYTNYLDPEKKSISSRYFKIDFSIKRLTVIITTNTHTEPTPENLPLTSRLTFVHFQRLEGTAVKLTMDKKIEALKEWGELPKFMNLSYVSPTQIQVTYKGDQLKKYGIFESIPSVIIPIALPSDRTAESITPRDLEHKYLKTTITELTKNGRKKYDEGLQKFRNLQLREGKDLLVQAALMGHPKALIFLKEFQRIHLTYSDLGKYSLQAGYYHEIIEDTKKAKKWYKIGKELGNAEAGNKLKSFESNEEQIRPNTSSPTMYTQMALPNFPEYSGDDELVKKTIAILHKLKDKAALLNCKTEEEHALQELLGTPGLWGYYGLIRHLWETRSWHDGGWWNEKPGSTRALCTRLEQVSESQQQEQILKFHLQLVMSLTDTLLFKYRGVKISKDKYNINTIINLIQHIEILNKEHLPNNDIYLNEYKKWFKTKTNIGLGDFSKTDLLLQLIIQE